MGCTFWKVHFFVVVVFGFGFVFFCGKGNNPLFRSRSARPHKDVNRWYIKIKTCYVATGCLTAASPGTGLTNNVHLLRKAGRCPSESSMSRCDFAETHDFSKNNQWVRFFSHKNFHQTNFQPVLKHRAQGHPPALSHLPSHVILRHDMALVEPALCPFPLGQWHRPSCRSPAPSNTGTMPHRAHWNRHPAATGQNCVTQSHVLTTAAARQDLRTRGQGAARCFFLGLLLTLQEMDEQTWGCMFPVSRKDLACQRGQLVTLPSHLFLGITTVYLLLFCLEYIFKTWLNKTFLVSNYL